jgi:hypothetical protein
MTTCPTSSPDARQPACPYDAVFGTARCAAPAHVPQSGRPVVSLPRSRSESAGCGKAACTDLCGLRLESA